MCYMLFNCSITIYSTAGTVPDCTECHPCFLQWYNRIQQILDMIAILERQATSLIDDNYNGYTVEIIEADIQRLLDQLANASATLQSITLESSNVQQLQQTLLEVYIS